MTPRRRLGRGLALTICVGLGTGLWVNTQGRADPVSETDEKAVVEKATGEDTAASEKPEEADRSEQTPHIPPPRPTGGPRIGAGTRGGAPLPEYIPPPRPSVGKRVGAATRGGPRVEIALLAPDHVGLTTAAQPILYWSIGEKVKHDVVISIVADANTTAEPLLEVVASRSPRAGIHAFPLGEQGVSLELGETYQLSARLVIDPERPWRNQDYGAVERVEADPKLRAELAATDSDRHYLVYARHGIWFDALQQLSEQIAKRPQDRGLRTARAVLLEQVEHGTAADWDREFAPSP